ncbi:hypothetical protein [Thermococcus sp. LS2]|uniref:hypothetical protein n=1 Tax=Thermococcus sp. LS2 TaxID=1638260 RepID=UPI00143B905A|nr:hypothetical protein [Thermococcus sp. LS2]
MKKGRKTNRKKIKECIEAVKAVEKLNKLLNAVDLDEVKKEAEGFRKKFKLRDFCLLTL